MTQYDGSPWNDPYDGLIWENKDIPKPSKEDLTKWARELEAEYALKQNKLANEPIYQQLDALDIKSIRALRTNDINRLAEIEQEAQALRAQLLPAQQKGES